MRVLFVTEEPIRFSSAMVRGGQIHVRNVVSGLRDRGHDVHLVDWNTLPEQPFQHSIDPALRFVDGPIRTLRQIVGVGQESQPDVIVSKTRKVYLPGLLAARWLGVPHVVHVGSSLDPPAKDIVNRLDAASFAGRLRAPHDAYLVVCESIREELTTRNVATDRIYNIQNAVDTDQFRPNPDVELPANVAERISDTEGPVLGYVGGLVRYKGVFDLAKAVLRTEIDPTVVIAGDGPARNRLENEFGDQGIFLGSVPYERMPAVYAALDAFVLPSHTEGLPRVVLEAGAAGIPVVATRVGGVSEVVRDNETGLLCPPREPAALADRIDELFTEHNPAKMGQTARDWIGDTFTWATQYDRYERFLQVIANGKE